MNTTTRFSLIAAVSVSLLTAVTAQAQEPTTPAPDNSTTANQSETKAYTRTVRDIVGRITEGAGSGIRVVADSTVAEMKAPLPDATTPANFEAQIAALVAALPKGTTWAKFYLPAADARSYKGDDVSDYGLAESKLFGKVGAAPTGVVEVMGKTLPADKAQAVIDALDLKPVYLITNPTLKAGAWSSMTDEQKQLYAQKEAQKLLNMDPQTRTQQLMNFMGQQAAILGQMYTQMTPEQRDQMRQSMMEQMRAGGAMMNFGQPVQGTPRGRRTNNGGQ